MGSYNRKSEYTSETFAPGSRKTQGYLKKQDQMELSDGRLLSYIHSAVDRGRGQTVESAGFYKILGIEDDEITMSRIGTDFITEIQHLDPEQLAKYKVGYVFAPKSVITTFPKENYGSGSTRPHIHIAESKKSSDGSRVFVDPDTHTNEQSWDKFPGKYEVKASSIPVLSILGYNQELITTRKWDGIIPPGGF